MIRGQKIAVYTRASEWIHSDQTKIFNNCVKPNGLTQLKPVELLTNQRHKQCFSTLHH